MIYELPDWRSFLRAVVVISVDVAQAHAKINYPSYKNDDEDYLAWEEVDPAEQGPTLEIPIASSNETDIDGLDRIAQHVAGVKRLNLHVLQEVC